MGKNCLSLSKDVVPLRFRICKKCVTGREIENVKGRKIITSVSCIMQTHLNSVCSLSHTHMIERVKNNEEAEKMTSILATKTTVIQIPLRPSICCLLFKSVVLNLLKLAEH